MRNETTKKIVQILINTINIVLALIIIALAIISIFDKKLILQVIDWI
jgi:hypothetical protein